MLSTCPLLESTSRPFGSSPTTATSFPSGLRELCCYGFKNCNFVRSSFIYPQKSWKNEKLKGAYVDGPEITEELDKLISLHVEVSDSTVII